jgi:opacity protein-like surface antigen
MKKILCVLLVLAVAAAAVFSEEPAEEPAEKKADSLRNDTVAFIAAVEKVPKFSLSAGAGGVFVLGFGGRYDGDDTKTLSLDLGGGGYAFLDATFVELSVGYSGGRTAVMTETGNTKTKDANNFGILDVSLLGKYPIVLGKTSLFPLFGASYNRVFSPEGENIWRIQFGGGMDYKFNERLYLRGQALFGVRLPWENDDGLDLHADYRTRLALGYTF